MTCILTVLLVCFLGSSGQLESCRNTFNVALRHSGRSIAESKCQMCLSGVRCNDDRVKTLTGLLNAYSNSMGTSVKTNTDTDKSKGECRF